MAKPTGSGLGSSSRSRSRSISYTSSSTPPPKKSFVTHEAMKHEAMMQVLEEDRILREEAIQAVYHRLGALQIEMMTLEARITKLELGAPEANQRAEDAEAIADVAEQRANALQAILVSLFG